jgi:short chain dehydrogenase
MRKREVAAPPARERLLAAAEAAHAPPGEQPVSVWFSRGFGIEITRQALGRGGQVAATARHPEAITEAIPDAGDALLTLPLDVTSAGQAAAAVSATAVRFGRIDSLVNDAARGLLGRSRSNTLNAQLRAAKGRWVLWTFPVRRSSRCSAGPDWQTSRPQPRSHSLTRAPQPGFSCDPGGAPRPLRLTAAGCWISRAWDSASRGGPDTTR